MKRFYTILRLVLLILSVGLFSTVSAQQIEESEAVSVALDFFKSNQTRLKMAASDVNQLDLVYTEPSADDFNVANLYVFNRKDGGFAIVAGDARANDLLGPEYPVVSRVKNLYIKQMLVKFRREHNAQYIKNLIAEQIHLFQQNVEYKSVQIQIDVDPM